MRDSLLPEDKEFIASSLADLYSELSGKSLFLTGGTGFVGKNILQAIQVVNEARNGPPLAVTVLSRNPDLFLNQNPGFASDVNLHFVVGDVKAFDWSNLRCDYIMHGASDVGDKTKAGDHQEILSVHIEGTRRTLAAAEAWGVKGYLLLSSGAVYGRQDPSEALLSETNRGGPDPQLPESAYGEGKRVSEWLTYNAGRTAGLPVKVARLFAFLGPWLPLDGPFAAGNFARDCQNRKEISIQGDGTPIRSYLYSVELAVWLLRLLVLAPKGSCYNVGSDAAISIETLANLVNREWNSARSVKVAGKAEAGKLPERYVPCVNKIFQEIGLKQQIPLNEALRRYRTWMGD